MLERDVGVENRADHADVQTDEVQSGENIVTADVHSDVGDHDVLRIEAKG